VRLLCGVNATVRPKRRDVLAVQLERTVRSEPHVPLWPKSAAPVPAIGMLLIATAERGLESPLSTKVSRIWNLVRSLFASCRLTMDGDDTTIV